MTTVTTWTTKGGLVVPIKEMTTQHLYNAIAMLRSKGHVTEYEYQFALGTAYSFTGEMSSYYAEAEIAQMQMSPALGALEEELTCRLAAK